MTAQEWILLLLVGGLLGTVGQGIRVVVGLKKIYDQSVDERKPFSDYFNGATLLFSLLIGFVAGVLGMVSLPKLTAAQIQTDQIVTLMGIGYAGCDFIEGFIKRSTPKLGGAPVMDATAGSPASKIDIEQPPMG
jgi:hypothetical protein